MNEKILVTGGAGFLGHHVVKDLLLRGFRVAVVDNMVGGSKENVDCWKSSIFQDRFEFYLVDCTDYRRMHHVFMAEHPTHIFHAACYPHEGLSINSPYLVAANSVGAASMCVASLACKFKVKRLVNCSSMARYGYQETVPFTEDMTPRPVDPYGIFKFAAETAMQKLCEHHGVEFVNLVPHNIYGPNQKYDDPFRNVIAIMMNRALQRKQPIIYGDGQQKRCFSYVDDLLPAILQSLASDLPVGQTINLGPEEPFVTINHIAKLITLLAGMPFDPIYTGARPAEVKHANCSSARSRTLLGAGFPTELTVGLEHMWNWMKAKGPKPFNYHLPLEIVSENTPTTWTKQEMND